MQLGAVNSVQEETFEEETGNEDLNGHGECGSESWDSYLGMVRETRIRSFVKKIPFMFHFLI